MDIDKLQRHKIEKFFHSESGERCMKIAGELLQKAIDNINNEMCDRFTDYLVDEYSLFYADRVRDGIIQQVSALLAGDDEVLERYKLKASNWGLPCDHDGIRRKIVQENADVIKDTYIQSLEEENERLRERIKVREDFYQYETNFVDLFMDDDVITSICINACELNKQREAGAYNVISDIIDDLQILQDHIDKENK